MPYQEKLNTSSIVGGGLYVAASDGQKVFEEIEDAISFSRSVCISFMSVKDLTTAFLNCAIGQLNKKYSEQEIKIKAINQGLFLS